MDEHASVSETDTGPGPGEHGVLNAPKLLRLASMLGAGLEEARASEEGAAMARAASVLGTTVVEAGSAVADDMLAELANFFARSGGDVTERERELVTAQLLGWLLGALADPTAWVHISGIVGDPGDAAAA